MAMAVGPILGGWLVTYMSWHWIFLINIPIGMIGVVIAGKYMPNTRYASQKLDWFGFLLFESGLVGLTFGLELVSEDLANALSSFLIMGLGISLITFYCIYANRVTTPLLPLALFRIRTFRIGMIANLLVRLTGSGIPFLIPLMLQVALQQNAATTGWLMAPLAISSIVVKPLVTKALNIWGYKRSLIFSAVSLTLSIIAMGWLDQDTSFWLLVILLSGFGACMSLLFTAVNALTVGDLDQDNSNAGSTMMSVVQQVGIGIGIAVSAVIGDLSS
ncbi:multidrug or homocysteine efflux system [[Haemophilus] ducreyi]|nr:multidrug or homocysteine efflux system [[Haemophilus] ducreyi]